MKPAALFYAILLFLIASTCTPVFSNAQNNDIAAETYQQAITDFNSGKLSKANDGFNKVLHYKSGHSASIFQLALLALYTDEQETALQYLNKAKSVTTQQELLLQIDFIQAFLDNNTDAIQSGLEELEKLESTSDMLPIYQAMAHYANHKFFQAKTILAPMTNPFNFQVYYWLAKIDFEKGDYEQALKYGNEILKVTADLIPIMMVCGDCHLNQGNHEQSCKIFQKILAEQPDNLSAHCGCGKSQLFTNEPNKALPHFEYIMNALDQKQLNWKCYWNIATCYTMMDRKQDAFNVLNAFKDKCRSQSNPLYLAMINHKIAEFHYLSGDFVSAEKEYNNWLAWIESADFQQQYKDNQKARFLCDMLQVSITQNNAENISKFMGQYQQLLNKDISIRICNKFEGLQHFQAGDYNKAVAAFDQMQDSSEKWYWIGRSYHAMQETDKASQYYSRLVEQKATNFYSILYANMARGQLTSLSML